MRSPATRLPGPQWASLGLDVGLAFSGPLVFVSLVRKTGWSLVGLDGPRISGSFLWIYMGREETEGGRRKESGENNGEMRGPLRPSGRNSIPRKVYLVGLDVLDARPTARPTRAGRSRGLPPACPAEAHEGRP